MSETVADRIAIEELKYQYCYATDAIDKSAFLDVFTDDAYFEIGIYGDGQGTEDLADFVDWLGDLEYESRGHNVSNPIIDINGDTATGKWYYIVMYHAPDGTLEIGQGEYHDEYRKVDGEWKIESLVALRNISTSFPGE